jgi:hypothetical protein
MKERKAKENKVWTSGSKFPGLGSHDGVYCLIRSLRKKVRKQPRLQQTHCHCHIQPHQQRNTIATRDRQSANAEECDKDIR